MHRPQARILRAQIEETIRRGAGALGLVVDVGCGPKPYYPWLAGRCDRYVGLDLVPSADVFWDGGPMPIDDGSADLVLCTQVLEHVPDPVSVVDEIGRILAPGGVALLTTHGVYPYHPNPTDFWRWTSAGLAKLHADTGRYGDVAVIPCGGTAACLLLPVTIYAGMMADKARSSARAPIRPLAAVGDAGIVAVNAVGHLVDARGDRGRGEARPNSMTSNFVVVARARAEASAPSR